MYSTKNQYFKHFVNCDNGQFTEYCYAIYPLSYTSVYYFRVYKDRCCNLQNDYVLPNSVLSFEFSLAQPESGYARRAFVVFGSGSGLRDKLFSRMTCSKKVCWTDPAIHHQYTIARVFWVSHAQRRMFDMTSILLHPKMRNKGAA